MMRMSHNSRQSSVGSGRRHRKFVDELTGDYVQLDEGVIEKHCSDSRDVPLATHVYTHRVDPPPSKEKVDRTELLLSLREATRDVIDLRHLRDKVKKKRRRKTSS